MKLSLHCMAAASSRIEEIRIFLAARADENAADNRRPANVPV
jgi:hypothetical protein